MWTINAHAAKVVAVPNLPQGPGWVGTFGKSRCSVTAVQRCTVIILNVNTPAKKTTTAQQVIASRIRRGGQGLQFGQQLTLAKSV